MKRRLQDVIDEVQTTVNFITDAPNGRLKPGPNAANILKRLEKAGDEASAVVTLNLPEPSKKELDDARKRFQRFQ